ncbi:hypothetical protein N7448_001474 [Penicillium atrosanguineum]|uniref:DUF7708 domain-containing protein n=1 Tax=Penicillium atrosanguineum TaxID=1132637 RepID=A0A9W9U8A7_9EURO|nr:uncharacterized protein N7443_004871 [Penicillium atrosanguineum]KAJ5133498.1 hypothetical protein N7526_004863 [Penicillium atrosanguineum]KAJ5149896.1 hypothetical protein N7448_001474 [Penicillium atrosanguineum]KAJ5305211.1 hypothetical protein N7443_004871 [Penicillium atrosanguineum]KAJ5324676.1 hypothetical protein N7476_003276 [Penicillium atrosanguineum]
MPSELPAALIVQGWKPVSSNPAIADLDIEHTELAQTWRSFVRHLIPEDTVEWVERPQTSQDVQALVRNLQSLWASQPRHRVFRFASSLCDRFIPTVETHATLLATLADSDSYHGPLFYGALQSVLKASANYPRVMEGLLTTLLNIHSALAPLADRVSSVSVESIAKLYALVFFLLTEFMDWYVRRFTCQLLPSHSQDPYTEFNHLVSCIQRQAKAVESSSDSMDVDEDSDAAYSPRALWEDSQLSQVGRQGTERRIAAQNTITRRLIWEIQQDAEERTRIRETRDQLLVQMVEAVSQQLRPVSEQSSGIVCLTTAAPDLVTSSFEWSRGSKRRLARLELQSASKHLQAFFDSDDQIADLPKEVLAETSVITSLQKWARNPRSQALAVGGSQETTAPSPVALISACYSVFARRSQLPVISHFCALPAHGIQGVTPHQQGLIALTYSLIRQLIDSLPSVVDSDALLDLSAERFRMLDGTMSSWKPALALVDTLLHFLPPLLLLIIDGVDTIHDSSTDTELRDLIRVLLTHTRHQPQSASSGGTGPMFLFKVLFTVAGRPSALVETMSENQLVLTDASQTDELTPSDAVLTSDLGAVMMNA